MLKAHSEVARLTKKSQTFLFFVKLNPIRTLHHEITQFLIPYVALFSYIHKNLVDVHLLIDRAL